MTIKGKHIYIGRQLLYFNWKTVFFLLLFFREACKWIKILLSCSIEKMEEALQNLNTICQIYNHFNTEDFIWKNIQENLYQYLYLLYNHTFFEYILTLHCLCFYLFYMVVINNRRSTAVYRSIVNNCILYVFGVNMSMTKIRIYHCTVV